MSSQTLTIKLPKPHPAQDQILRESKRFNIVACGRRFGKTQLGINRLIEPALKGKPCAWFSPTYKMLGEVWREVCLILRPVIGKTNAQERRIDLITGGIIDFWSLEEPDAVRGRKYALAIIDEAAMVAKLNDAWQNVIRPTLTDLQGAAWFFSTPRGFNFFRELFERGKNPDSVDYKSWQMPTVNNPFIAVSEIEKARAELPERNFAQEYLAQFLEDGGGVFRFVQDSATAQKQDKAIENHSYVIGVDWAKRTDFSVFCVVDETLQECVYLDRSNRIDYVLQRDRLKALCEKFQPHTVVAEINSIGEPNIEILQRDGLPVRPFQTTNASKANAIEMLALAFEKDEIKILNHSDLIYELQAFEATTLPSGLTRYAAPENVHDDCVMSLAMAWFGAKKLNSKVEHGMSIW